MALLVWLIESPDSPLESFFTEYSSLQSQLAFFHIIPFIVATIVSGNIHGSSPSGDFAYWTMVAVQWSLPGFVLALLFKRPTVRRPAK